MNTFSRVVERVVPKTCVGNYFVPLRTDFFSAPEFENFFCNTIVFKLSLAFEANVKICSRGCS